MKKVLVLGASGLVGRSVCEALSSDYEIYGTYCNNKIKPSNTMMVKLDIANEDQILNILQTTEPDVVISSLRGDFIYQLQAHTNIANYLKNHGGRLIYLSTANVFDAVTNKAHSEHDEPDAVSDYGKFKIKCEKVLRDILGPLLTIVRLPMIFGIESKRVQEIEDGLKRGAPLIVYRDFYLNIHSDVLLAKQLAYLVDNDYEGILHLGSHDVVGYDEAMALLTKQLGHKGTKLQYERIQDQPYYLALKSERNPFPVHLMFSAEQVIESIEA